METTTLSARERAFAVSQRPKWMCGKPAPTLIELNLRMETAEAQLARQAVEIKQLRAELATLRPKDN